jgi:hypothetical protein
MKPRSIGLDEGLLDRFRHAGTQVAWETSTPPRSRSPRRPSGAVKVRIAKLNDESARVMEVSSGRNYRLTVDSGPVGALLVLLACAERGPPVWLHPRLAGDLPDFPSGAIEAGWGKSTDTGGGGLRIADLVPLARYALA